MEQIAIVAERGGSAVAMTGGFISWLNEYQQAITTLCTMGGFAVAVLGFLVHWWFLVRNNREKYGRRGGDSE